MRKRVYFTYNSDLITYSDDGANPVVAPCTCSNEGEGDCSDPDFLCLNKLARRGVVGAVDCSSCNPGRVWGFSGRCIECHKPVVCMFHAED